MIFWTVAISAALVSTVVIFFSINRQALPVNPEHRIVRNVRLYQQRLAVVEEELEQGIVDREVYDVLEQELSQRLLQDVTKLQSASSHAGYRKQYLYLLLPFPFLAFALYYAIGAYSDWQIYQRLQRLSEVTSQSAFDRQSAQAHSLVAERLKQRPNNIDYRLMLANFAMQKSDYADAVLHYSVLAELLPADPNILAYYAQAEYLYTGRQFTALVTEYMQQALSINAVQKTALGMQGILSFELGDYAAAIKAWESLLSVLEPGDAQVDIINAGLQQAKRHLDENKNNNKLSTTQSDSELTAEADNGVLPGIVVNVSLGSDVPSMDDALFVFIYAKAANGPPMPLAVKRVQLKELPVRVVLNDRMAMMPQMTLSQFSDVLVGARLSLSGQPSPGVGDWQTEISVAKWQEHSEITIVIQEQL